MQPYYTIEQMLELIDEPNRAICQRILVDNRKLFQTVQGSTNNHQAWAGGYFDHVQEAMNIGVVLYDDFSRCRHLPFSLSDLLLVVYFHDIEKPWKYELREDGQLYHKPHIASKGAHQKFRMEKLAEYGIVLTPEQENGIKYAEGEVNDYSSRLRVMCPLAAMAHMCDVASARIWFDHPMKKNDPWTGAGRMRE